MRLVKLQRKVGIGPESEASEMVSRSRCCNFVKDSGIGPLRFGLDSRLRRLSSGRSAISGGIGPDTFEPEIPTRVTRPLSSQVMLVQKQQLEVFDQLSRWVALKYFLSFKRVALSFSLQTNVRGDTNCSRRTISSEKKKGERVDISLSFQYGICVHPKAS